MKANNVRSITFNINLILGDNIIEAGLREQLGALGSRDILLVASPTSYSMVGDDIKRRFPLKEVAITRGRASIKYANELSSKCEDKSPLIVGLGGGSVQDLAKYVAWRCRSHLILIPTILSSNALASPFSVLEDDQGNLQTLRTKNPDIIIADMDMLMRQPKRFILSGLGDLIAKYTSIPDYILSSIHGGVMYDRVAVTIARSLLDVAFENAELIASTSREGLELLLQLLMMDGYLMNLTGTSRIVAGCEHLIAYGIERISAKGLHGEQVALGTIICSYLQGRDWMKLVKLYSNIGLPVKARDLGLTNEEIVNAFLVAAKTRPWTTILGEGKYDENTATQILKNVKVIE